MRSLAAVFLVLLGGHAVADVNLSDEQRNHLGIQSEPVRVVQTARSWRAAGTVVDVSNLIGSLSDLTAAETAARASRDEADRADKLYRNDTNVARKAVDAARSQAIADEGKVATTRGQLLATWGRAIATLQPAARQQLVSDLLGGRASLVRAEQLAAIPADARITSAHLTGMNGGSWHGAALGPLPQAAGATSTGAMLVKVNGALPSGQFLEVVLVEVGASVQGVTVPAAAIIHWHGGEWVYEESSQNHFVRRAVRAGPRVGGRALVDGGLPANDLVVIVGARALLGAELGEVEHADGGGD